MNSFPAVFQQDGEEALQGAEDRPVQHDGRAFRAVLVDVVRAESLGHVQIDLQRAALPVTSDGITQHELQLGTIERPFPRIEGVLDPGRLRGSDESLLGMVPNLIPADPLGRAVGKFDAQVLEAEVPIDIQDELGDRDAFGGDLLLGDEDVGIILCEGTHAHQTV